MGVHVPPVPGERHLHRKRRRLATEGQLPRVADDCTLLLHVAAARLRMHGPELVLRPELDRHGELEGCEESDACLGDRCILDSLKLFASSGLALDDAVDVGLRNTTLAYPSLDVLHREAGHFRHTFASGHVA